MTAVRPHGKSLKAIAELCAALVAIAAWRFVDPPTYEIEYTLPADATRVVAKFTRMRMRLAEYERSVIVVRSDGKRSEAKLFPDTGGYRRSQLYQAENCVLYIKGYFDVARIDASTASIEHVDGPVPAGAKYLGAFDYVRTVGWKFLSPSESPEQPLVAKGG